MNDRPEPLARYKTGVPEGMQRIVDKALAKDKEERYQDADDLLADLKHEKRLLESGEASHRAQYPFEAVKAHYVLGLAYERSGWTKGAMKQYGEFLEIWKDADPGIPEIEDARQRLAQLKTSS
jgi:tetratricopeptide (TPR) repeat protein